VINLMDALKRSLAEEGAPAETPPRRAASRPAAEAVPAAKPAPRGRKSAPPSGQRSLLLPVEGGRGKASRTEAATPVAEAAAVPAPAAKRRKRA
jgi:hypothetical protein